MDNNHNVITIHACPIILQTLPDPMSCDCCLFYGISNDGHSRSNISCSVSCGSRSDISCGGCSGSSFSDDGSDTGHSVVTSRIDNICTGVGSGISSGFGTGTSRSDTGGDRGSQCSGVSWSSHRHVR